ncbi:MAG: hypothetical protein QXZ24_02420, partial [Candidatus Jordarchaeales archaeon]
MKVKRALISVWNKEGVYRVAKRLHELGVEIIATEGTARALEGLPVKKISEITGFADVLDGRVKSLHPYIYTAILAREREKDLAQLREM